METPTRQKLIDSYLALGEEYGFDTVSLGTLSKEVGITKSTIFSHFNGSE
ncbi:MAG: TetR/AcrR family transcriptional regulator, partial [Spirochaetales bacterium]